MPTYTDNVADYTPGAVKTVGKAVGTGSLNNKRLRDIERTQGQRLLTRAGIDATRQYQENFLANDQALKRTAMGGDAGTVVQGTRDAVTQAGQDADIAAGAFNREREGLGLGAPRQSDLRQLGLSRVLAQVDAGNRTSDTARNRQEAAQQWGAQQWGADQSEAVRSLSNIAQSEFDRYSQYKQAKEQRRSAAVGLATTGIGMAAAAFSDRRAKRDIVKVGQLPNGINLYNFKYLWSEHVHTGVMSDEVRHIPGAVIPGLFDRVDYSKVMNA